MSREFLAAPPRIKVWLHNPDWNHPVKSSIATNSSRLLFTGQPCAKAYFYATYLKTEGNEVIYIARCRAFANAWKKITGMRQVTSPLELDCDVKTDGCVDTFNRCHTDQGVRIKVNHLIDHVGVTISKSSPALLA